MVSPVLLELAAEMIHSGAGRDAIRFQMAAATRRQKLAVSMLGPDGSAPTSLHYWLRLPQEMRTAMFVADALAHGVAVTPGDAFTVIPWQDPGGVRICLCAEPSTARVEEALATVARLLHADHIAAVPII